MYISDHYIFLYFSFFLMKKLFVILPLMGLLFLYGCGSKTATPIAEISTPTIVDCKNDMACLQQNFIACTAATFTMPFSATSNYTIEIIGKKDNVCDYKMMVGDINESIKTQCRIPMEMMNTDRLGHLFWSEKVPGKEDIAKSQQQLDMQYCM